MTEPGRTPDLTIVREAATKRTDLDGTSWVEVIHGFVRNPAEELERLLRDLPWAQNEVLRYDRYVPEKRLSAGVRAGADPLMRQTDMHLKASYRQAFDGVAALLYRDGSDFQGLHSDREMRWLDDTLIAIIVLGVRRPFVFRKRTRWVDSLADRAAPGEGDDDIVLEPGEGDMLVMGGRCQADWLHAVPAATTDQSRISLTWRWTSRLGRPDTNPGYYDGRQYSDRPRQAGSRTRS